MPYKAETGRFTKVLMPTTANGDTSESFPVPSGAKTLIVHVPSLVGAATTLKIASLQPRDSDQDSETWTDLSIVAIGSADLTYVAFDGIPESSAVNIPVTALGGGNFRFVASVAQTTTAANAMTIHLQWGFDG